MNKSILKIMILVMLNSVVMESSALAESYEKMDSDTTTLVIDKLESALKKSSTNESETGSLQLRLGDLFAERARLKIMKEMEKSCESCLGSKSDREKALAYYEQALPFVAQELRGGLLLQMAHLNRVLSRKAQAEKYYVTVIQEGRVRHGGKVMGQSLSSYADFLYENNNYKKAEEFYHKAISNKGTPQLGTVKYKLGWCLLNLGKDEAAKSQLISVLRSPTLLDLDNNGEIDFSFQQDVAKDLSSFMGKGKISRKDYELISSLSPAERRLQNLIFLAEEAEHLGMKPSALVVWNELFKEKELKTEQKIKGQIHVMQLLLDMDQKAKASDQAGRVAASFRSNKCNDKDECETLRIKMRDVIIDWNKLEKKKPTEFLLSSYGSYVQVFSDDFEMQYWTAQLARELKSYAKAYNHYALATDLTAPIVEKNKDKKVTTIFEGSLLGQIEMAEASQNKKLMLNAYNRYLALNPTGPKASEVFYQKARTTYDLKDYSAASDLFLDAALNKKDLPVEMRIQAADLCLDALALQKRDEDIESTATKFAQVFSNRATEYNRLARTSMLNQSHTALTKEKSGQYEKMLAKLKAADIKTATYEERIQVLKNRVILAERLQNLNEVESAAQLTVETRSLTENDKNWAYSKLAWVAEMRLDFKKAYALTSKMELKDLKKDERALKLGILADLAGMKSRPYFEEFMDATRDVKRANIVRADLIRNSANPFGALEKDLNEMAKTPQILGDLTLEIFSKKGNHPVVEKIMKIKSMRSIPATQFLGKILFMREYAKYVQELKRHKIQYRSDAVLQKSLQDRLALIVKGENWGTQAVASQDWLLQLLTLSQLSQANHSVAGEIKNLPAPRGLNAKQKVEYKTLLAQKANEFENKGLAIDAKLKEFWRSDSILVAMAQQYRVSQPDIQKLFEEEIRTLQGVAPSYMSARLGRVLKFRTEKPSRSDILEARANLKGDPFSVRRAQSLKELEAKNGQSSMVGYLDIRIHQLKGANL